MWQDENMLGDIWYNSKDSGFKCSIRPQNHSIAFVLTGDYPQMKCVLNTCCYITCQASNCSDVERSVGTYNRRLDQIWVAQSMSMERLTLKK